MSGPHVTAPEHTLTSAVADSGEESTFADRIDILYRLGRHYLSFPFAALCVVAVLYQKQSSILFAVTPMLAQIAATVATGWMARRYAKRPAGDDPQKWASRYTLMSAVAGASWGLGAFMWFNPHAFSAQAFLSLAFLGMTAAEFIARCAYRRAYIAHATLSLGPLAMRLALAGGAYSLMSSVLVLFFGGVLYSYCDAIAAMLDESVRLRRRNAALLESLSQEKVQAEEARDRAQASTRAKSAFIANVSHELRTPLNALLGMAQLLESSNLDRTQLGHVKVVLEAGRGLKTLLDDVIALSRDEGSYDGNNEEDCDAEQAARTVARLLQPRAWEKQLRLSVNAAANLPRVASDPRRVRRVLLKLADNAVKFTDRGGVEISVAAENRSDGSIFLRFSVSDTGLGIPPEVCPHVFEPFAQTDISYARRNEGAGLGLAVAKRTVEALGGEIGFESEPGDGATFWFTVPGVRAQRADDAGEATPIAADAPPPWNLIFLVCVPDENAARQLRDLLEPFGNRLTVSATVAETIALAGRGDYDAVIAVGADADSIAAAPSVKAPVLALVPRAAKAPMAAGEMLRWPANAGALYAALRELLGRVADAGAPREEQPADTVAAIDAPSFAALEKSLGLTTLLEILQSYMRTSVELCGKLSAASEQDDWEESARVAQDIAGAAGGLGLAALTAAARSFINLVRDRADSQALRNAIEAIVIEHQRACRALSNLYPDLAA